MRRAFLLAVILLLATAGSASATPPVSNVHWGATTNELVLEPVAGDTITLTPGVTEMELTSIAGWQWDGGHALPTFMRTNDSVSPRNMHLANDFGSGTQSITITPVTGSGTTIRLVGSASAWPANLQIDAATGNTVSLSAGTPFDLGDHDLTFTGTGPTLLANITTTGGIDLPAGTQITGSRGLTGATVTTRSPTGTGALSVVGRWEARGAATGFTSITAGATRLNGSITATGPVTLSSLAVDTTGTAGVTAPMLHVEGPVTTQRVCGGAGPSLCSTGGGLFVTGGAWFDGTVDVDYLTVSGNARLGGDVTTSSYQQWHGDIGVYGPATLTLTGTSITTDQDIGTYLGPLGALVGASTFAHLVVDGSWSAGGAVTPTTSIIATGPTTASGTAPYSTFSPSTAGTQDYRNGLFIDAGRAATISGSTVTINGMPELDAVGGIRTKSCDSGPLTVIGELHFTAAVDCLSSLIASGPATIAANVSTTGSQTYLGATTIVLGSEPISLRSASTGTVQFPESVAASWSAATGAVAGYTAEIAPAGRTCSTTGALTCSFGAVDGASSHTFSVSTQRPTAASSTASAAPHHRVKRGSRTALTSLLAVPRVTGRRSWSERGACWIVGRVLVAPKRAATCTLVLRIRRAGKVAWSGQSLVDVR